MFRKRLYRTLERMEGPAGPESAGLWQRMDLHLDPGDGAGTLWPRLEERLSRVRFFPRLQPGLVLKASDRGEDAAYLLSDAARGRYFRLGEREAVLLSLLDGEHELQDVVRDYAARCEPISTTAVERFLHDLRLAGLLDEEAGLWQRLLSARRSGPLILWMLTGSEEKLARLQRRLRLLFTPVGAGLVLLILLAGLLLFLLHLPVLGADLAVLRAAWWKVPLLLGLTYVAVVPVILSHELAHALACIHFGGRVARFGLMVRHLLPAAFADVSDVWTMGRADRVRVFLAGPASTVLWSGLFTALWAWTPAGSWVHLLGGALMLLCAYSVLIGLLPVAGYDGSEILAEWLEVPDLHGRALRLLRAGRAEQAGTPRERRIVRRYAAGFLAYQVVVLALVVVIVWRVLLR